MGNDVSSRTKQQISVLKKSPRIKLNYLIYGLPVLCMVDSAAMAKLSSYSCLYKKPKNHPVK